MADSPAIPSQGLLAWFDAGDATSLGLKGDRVVSWTSKTAPACVATSQGTQRPEYIARPGEKIRSSIRFDGLDDVLRGMAFRGKADAWTLFVVAAPYTPCRGGGICSARSQGGYDYDPGFTVDLFQSSGAFDQISIEGAGRIGGQKDQMQSAFPCGGLHVITVVRDARQVDLFVDGHGEGSRPVEAAPTNMDELRIGARYYADQERNYFHGEIAQVLLYSRALGEEERVQVEEVLIVSKEECREGEEAFVRRQKAQRRDRMRAAEIVRAWASVDAFIQEEGGALNPAALPIRTDIREAMALCVRHLNSLYDKDKGGEPFFYVNRDAEGFGKMHHSVNIGIPHVVGRCLLGCMMAEQTAQIPFPADGLAILERYCRSSFDNPDHLNSYIDPERDGARLIEFHNMREGLYGLWALTSGRHSDWARADAHEMLETLDRLTEAEGRWSSDLAAKAGMADRCEGLSVPNAARMIDALLADYDCTGDALALKLAGLYAQQGLKTLFLEGGRFAPMERSSGHVHSITSSLSGIAAYAARADNADMLTACRRIIDVGVPEYFSSWGWGDEVFPEHPADVLSRGEINQTGDVIRTALILGDAGYPEYYEVAERFLRSMLLPTQHREQELRPILHDRPNPADDSERDTVQRSVGGYAMQLPNARMREGDWPISTLDITSGALHALSECYRHRTTLREGVYRMNLLFDFEDDALALDSQLPVQGRIVFRAKKDVQDLLIYIPRWVGKDSIRVAIGSAGMPVAPQGAYVHIGPLSAGATGTLVFEVPCKREKETVDGVEYTTTWVGNQVINIEPRGTEAPLPF